MVKRLFAEMRKNASLIINMVKLRKTFMKHYAGDSRLCGLSRNRKNIGPYLIAFVRLFACLIRVGSSVGVCVWERGGGGVSEELKLPTA